MRFDTIPYESVGAFRFGVSKEHVLALTENRGVVRRLRHAPDKDRLRCDPLGMRFYIHRIHGVSEIEFIEPDMHQIVVDGLEIRLDDDSVDALAARDISAQIVRSVLVLPKYGVTFMATPALRLEQTSITFFARGLWDESLHKTEPKDARA